MLVKKTIADFGCNFFQHSFLLVVEVSSVPSSFNLVPLKIVTKIKEKASS